MEKKKKKLIPFGGDGIWTHDFLHAKQALYHWVTPPDDESIAEFILKLNGIELLRQLGLQCNVPVNVGTRSP